MLSGNAYIGQYSSVNAFKILNVSMGNAYYLYGFLIPARASDNWNKPCHTRAEPALMRLSDQSHLYSASTDSVTVIGLLPLEPANAGGVMLGEAPESRRGQSYATTSFWTPRRNRTKTADFAGAFSLVRCLTVWSVA